MVKPDQIYNREKKTYSILSNTDGMIVYRELGFPKSELFQDSRPNFELRVKKLEFQEIEDYKLYGIEINSTGKLYENKNKIINFCINKNLKIRPNQNYRKGDRIYNILSNTEGMIVFRELGFPKSELFQDTILDFQLRIDNGEFYEIKDHKYIEVGDIYIMSRTQNTYEIMSIDRSAMIIKRFFKGEWKFCTNYGLYEFRQKIFEGHYILIKSAPKPV